MCRFVIFFFSSRRRHTRCAISDWSSDVCSSDLATIEDVGGILKLIEPLEADGTLVKRGRELIEREIDYFSVIEHDGVIYGCAALYLFPADKMAEKIGRASCRERVCQYV